ncbi:MAG: hypothetical protein GQ559_00010 [Desulfobulbaceae bacterium]|nr:hypothetical protein [Desulfobulbaceae bacterium]
MQFIPSNPSGNQAHRVGWFEQRRDHFMRLVVDEFFRQIRSFHDLYSIYLDCRKKGRTCSDLLSRETQEARDKIWDRLTIMVGTETEKGPLWQLKDLCHQVWPENEDHQDVNGSLVDWLIGSVFHEAMKLKENIYMLNSYGPAAFRMKDVPANASREMFPSAGTYPQLSHIVDIQGLLNRIVTDVAVQMEQIGFLFVQANYILRMMMPGLARNMLVVRLLAEQEDVIAELWGESLEEMYAEMFFGAAAAGFCAAGWSYLSGQWYVQALGMYRRAMDMDGQCDEAFVKIAQLEVMIRENSNLLGTDSCNLDERVKTF